MSTSSSAARAPVGQSSDPVRERPRARKIQKKTPKKQISLYLLVIFDLVLQDGQCCLLGLLPGESDAVGRRPVLLQSPDERGTWWRHGRTERGRGGGVSRGRRSNSVKN